MTVALEFVRERAKNALQAHQDEPLAIEQLTDLAAHFYALACTIPAETGSAWLHESVPRQHNLDVKIDLKTLSELSGDIKPSELYLALVSTLQSMQTELSTLTEVNPAATLPPRTKLRDSSELNLSGAVVHWLRPRSDWRWLRYKREEQAGDGAMPRPAPHPADSLHRLAMHWNADRRKARLVPSSKVDHRPVRLLEGLQRNPGKEAREFRIALCPLPCECNPHFDISADGQFFHAKHERSIHNWKALQAHLAALFTVVEEEKIHLLVLPEFMGDGQVEEYVLAQLCSRSGWPWAIVAGSFHRWPEGGGPKDRPPVNRAIFWSRRDIALLRHDKRGKFRVTRRQYKVARPIYFPDGPLSLPPKVKELVEHIEHDAEFHVLDTELGRFVVVICADLIAPDHTAIMSLVEDLFPDFVIVVSMTPETDLFEAVMKDLSRRRIASFFVNAACMCTLDNLLAAVDLGLYEPPGAPATRFHWRATSQGQGKLEHRYYHPAIYNKKEWHELETEDDGVKLLRHAGKPIALMIDLAPHFAWVSDEP